MKRDHRTGRFPGSLMLNFRVQPSDFGSVAYGNGKKSI